MIFDYKVKYNGVHYPAGVDVPMENVSLADSVEETSLTEDKVSEKKTGSNRKKKV